MFEGLPELCYSIEPLSGKTIILQRGQKGYNNLENCYEQMNPDEINEKLGITKAQSAAMLTGSMFGWDIPGANPEAYDENGKLKSKTKNRKSK